MRPLGLARADGELEGYGAVRRERCKKTTARWVGGGTRKPRPGGWAMVQEHHDLAGGRWCEKTTWAVVREDCDWVGS